MFFEICLLETIEWILLITKAIQIKLNFKLIILNIHPALVSIMQWNQSVRVTHWIIAFLELLSEPKTVEVRGCAMPRHQTFIKIAEVWCGGPMWSAYLLSCNTVLSCVPFSHTAPQWNSNFDCWRQQGKSLPSIAMDMVSFSWRCICFLSVSVCSSLFDSFTDLT